MPLKRQEGRKWQRSSKRELRKGSCASWHRKADRSLLVQAPYLATPVCHNFTQSVCLKIKDVLEIFEIIIEKFRRNGGRKSQHKCRCPLFLYSSALPEALPMLFLPSRTQIPPTLSYCSLR